MSAATRRLLRRAPSQLGPGQRRRRVAALPERLEHTSDLAHRPRHAAPRQNAPRPAVPLVLRAGRRGQAVGAACVARACGLRCADLGLRSRVEGCRSGCVRLRRTASGLTASTVQKQSASPSPPRHVTRRRRAPSPKRGMAATSSKTAPRWARRTQRTRGAALAARSGPPAGAHKSLALGRRASKRAALQRWWRSARPRTAARAPRAAAPRSSRPQRTCSASGASRSALGSRANTGGAPAYAR